MRIKINMIFVVLTMFFILLFTGCYTHEVDTVDEWCEEISGTDLHAQYRPFWAVVFRVSFHPEAVRDEYTEYLNKLHLEQVENRAPKMAWREGAELHLVNLSNFLDVEPEKIIDEWRSGIESTKKSKHHDPLAKCLYGALCSLFDNLHIHSTERDANGNTRPEKITVVTTDRIKTNEKDKL